MSTDQDCLGFDIGTAFYAVNPQACAYACYQDPRCGMFGYYRNPPPAAAALASFCAPRARPPALGPLGGLRYRPCCACLRAVTAVCGWRSAAAT